MLWRTRAFYGPLSCSVIPKFLALQPGLDIRQKAWLHPHVHTHVQACTCMVGSLISTIPLFLKAHLNR